MRHNYTTPLNFKFVVAGQPAKQWFPLKFPTLLAITPHFHPEQSLRTLAWPSGGERSSYLLRDTGWRLTLLYCWIIDQVFHCLAVMNTCLHTHMHTKLNVHKTQKCYVYQNTKRLFKKCYTKNYNKLKVNVIYFVSHDWFVNSSFLIILIIIAQMFNIF